MKNYPEGRQIRWSPKDLPDAHPLFRSRTDMLLIAPFEAGCPSAAQRARAVMSPMGCQEARRPMLMIRPPKARPGELFQCQK